MGLRTKIVLPLVSLGLLFAAYMWLIWAPGYLQEEREHYLGHYQMELDIFADGLTPLNGQWSRGIEQDGLSVGRESCRP